VRESSSFAGNDEEAARTVAGDQADMLTAA
jgi:hypothetical protein